MIAPVFSRFRRVNPAASLKLVLSGAAVTLDGTSFRRVNPAASLKQKIGREFWRRAPRVSAG